VVVGTQIGHWLPVAAAFFISKNVRGEGPASARISSFKRPMTLGPAVIRRTDDHVLLEAGARPVASLPLDSPLRQDPGCVSWKLPAEMKKLSCFRKALVMPDAARV